MESVAQTVVLQIAKTLVFFRYNNDSSKKLGGPAETLPGNFILEMRTGILFLVVIGYF